MNERLRLAVMFVGGAVLLVACGEASGGDDRDGPAPVITAAARAATATTVPSATPTSVQTALATATTTSSPEASATPVAATATSSTIATPVASTAQPAAQPAALPSPTAPAPRPSSSSITVRANNNAFDTARIRLPAGANISATMINDEAGVVHNLTFGLPGVPHGDDCTGPCTRTQNFRAPATPGSFFFLCTIHDMFGEVIVE